MNNTYSILRPPLTTTFELPSHDELLSLKPGDIVKVIFQVGDEHAERIWTTLKDCSKPDLWTGVTDNDPVGELTRTILPSGTLVSLHPLDIIAIY